MACGGRSPDVSGKVYDIAMAYICYSHGKGEPWRVSISSCHGDDLNLLFELEGWNLGPASKDGMWGAQA